MKTRNIISAIAASLLLAACGGNDTTNTTDSSASSNKVFKGYYVDSAVEGVEFNCTTSSGATQSGTTDANGTFTFKENQTCTFKIGDVVLREVNAFSLEHNVTIFEDNIRVAQFLQTLDSDGNASNGIQILPEAHELLKERNMTEVPQNDAELVDIKDDLKVKSPENYRGDIVSEQDAREHLDETRQRIEAHNQRTQDDVEARRSAEGQEQGEAHGDANQTRASNEESGSARGEMSESHEGESQTSREANQERTAEQDAMRESHEDANQTRGSNEESGSAREGMSESHDDSNQTRGSSNNENNGDLEIDSNQTRGSNSNENNGRANHPR